MGIIFRLLRLISFLTPMRLQSPLRTELANLRKNVERTDRYMAELEFEFWRNGGV